MFMTDCVAVVLSKTLTGYDVLVYVKLSLTRHLKQCHMSE